MGSDFHPKPDVEGAVLAAREFGVDIVLVGDERQIRPLLAAQDTSGLSIDVVHADEVLTMEDKGMALVLKAKRANAKNSMAIGIDLVKRGEAQAFVTMGNTGAASVTAYFRLGTIPGVDRPALAPALPNEKGAAVVLDVGTPIASPTTWPSSRSWAANTRRASAESPTRASAWSPTAKRRVVSNGEEAGKGSQLVKDAYPLIQATGVNFVGNVEGKEIFRGEVDVAVTDGFTGNVLLKSSEAVAKLLLTKIRDQLTNSGLLVKLGAAMVRPALKEVRKLLDPGEHGAAPLLGINGLVFIGHGHSDARAVMNAVRVAKQAVDADVVAAIRDAIATRLATPPAA